MKVKSQRVFWGTGCSDSRKECWYFAMPNSNRLDLPLSTFRRHLKNGMTRVAEILWNR
jgi:hypothetical protein